MSKGTDVIKPTHKAVKVYYEALASYADQGVEHESAVRSAFQNLLASTAKKRGWTLVPELSTRAADARVVPDGTVRDSFLIPRGYWEAKDTHDDLDVEIDKKLAKGYPTKNIIFEDTQNAVLIQDGDEAFRAQLSESRQLVDLLNAFLSHEEPNIEGFEKAVDEFQQRVPELAMGLVEKIRQAHQDNPQFIKAFNEFFALCQDSLNPNISEAAVDEMLVQHLLTERLMRTVFENVDFVKRNVIAAEVEKVIGALVSKSFDRHEFLKSLDRFYMAIEDAARGLADFSEKQHFLNTVYERFFKGYSVAVADTHGIVYTPQPIVDFMCASIEEVLETEFGKTLGSEDVNILDPCVGTGNFIVNLLRRMPKRDLKRMYREQLFANEVMLLPYYIAALNIEHAYYELTGEYEPFQGLCFVDTLDLLEKGQSELGVMVSAANTARVERQNAAPITVILGNPPYNVGQINENDNNKNRTYPGVEHRIRQTYVYDSKATNKNALWDAYVKFFRWATDRLEGRDGIVCFVSNNSFVHGVAFDGMRKHLALDFDRIYVLDLKGNIRKDSMRDGIPLGERHTVFGLSAMVGVSVTLLVRCAALRKNRRIFYGHVPFRSTRDEKFALLRRAGHVGGMEWRGIEPDTEHTWLVPEHGDEYRTFLPTGTKAGKSAGPTDAQALFTLYGRGVATCRDAVVYDFDRNELEERVRQFIEDYNSELDRWQRVHDKANVDDFVRYDKVNWSEGLKQHLVRGQDAFYDSSRIRLSLYRPFTKEYLYFDSILNERRYQFPRILPTAETEEENRAICVSGIGSNKPFHALVVRLVPCLDMLEKTQCLPFYAYDEDGSNRRENITDWALQKYRSQYKDKKIGKWDIFYYVYGLLHHPGYGEKYADCLKRELPRIPFAPDFWAFTEAGKELAKWHIEYEDVEPYELDFIVAKNLPLSYRVEDKMRLNKEKTALKVNRSLTLTGIPGEAFEYRLGNRSALEWVVDQYRVKVDKRSGIKSDPNRPDDEEYIVRLVGQVIRVSLETVRIVKALPDDFGG